MVILDPRTFKGDEPSNGGDDSSSTTTTTTTTSGGKYEDSRSDLEAAGYTVSDDGNSVYSDTGQVAGANWSGSGTVNSIVDDNNNSGGQKSTSQTIKSGDTVSQLALDNNTTIEQIKKDNPNIDINNIKAGETINITSNTRDEGESIYTGATQSELDAGNIMKVASTEDIMAEYEKLQAAGESDTSALDEIAAADTTGIDVYEPTQETVTAVQDYYTSGPGSPGYTTAVDYTTTSSGEDYSVAAAADDTDISGGVPAGPAYDEDFTSRVDKILVETHNWVDNGDGTFTSPSGAVLKRDPTDPDGKFVDAATAPEPGLTPVEVDTFSDSEITTPVSELAGPFDGTQTYEDTILEPGTGGISGIRVGDEMTPQLATELGITYFEGDTIQGSDLVKLDELGFDVSQADLSSVDYLEGSDVGTVELLAGSTKIDATKDGTIVEDRPGIEENLMTDAELAQVGGGPSGFIDDGVGQVGVVNPSAGGSVVVGGPEFVVVNPGPGTGVALTSIPSDMYDYIDTLNQQVGGFTFEDLEAAGYTPAEIKQYNDKVGPVPGMPVEGTMLYSSLYGGDGGVYTGEEVAADTTDILDYEDYITQGGQNPLGGGGLPDDFYVSDVARTVTVDGQQYAVGYGEGAIDPAFANIIEARSEADKKEALDNATFLTDVTNTLKSGLGQSVADKLQGVIALVDTYGKTAQINDAKSSIRAANPTLSDDEVDAKAIAQIIDASKTELVPGIKTNLSGLDTVLGGVVTDLRDYSDEKAELISLETQDQMNQSSFVGDFDLSDLGTFLETKGDASAKGVFFNALTELPDIATDVATYLTTGLVGTAAIGGAEGAGAAANDINQLIDGMVNAGELQNTQQYQVALAAANGDSNLAVEIIKQSTLQSSLAGVAAAAGLGDAVIAGLVTKNPLLEKVTDNFVGKIATGGLSEGLTEGTEQFITNYGLVNKAGADIVGLNYGTGVAGAATTGAVVGGGVGTTAAFVDVLLELANSGTGDVSELVANNIEGTSLITTASENLLNQTNASGDQFSVTQNKDVGGNFNGTYTVVNENTGESQVIASADLTTFTDSLSSEGTAKINTAVEYDGDNKTLTNTKTGFSVQLDSDTVLSQDIATAVANNQTPTGATLISGSDVGFDATTEGIAGVGGPEGAVGAVGGEATQKKQVPIGSTDIVTHGDVTVTTVVNSDGSTVVTTTNNVTNETTSDIVPNGTSTVITNGDTAVNVDASTATTTGTTTTVGSVDVVTTPVITTDTTPTTETATETNVAVTTTDDDLLPDVVEEEVVEDIVEPEVIPETPADDEPDLTGETAPTYTSGIAGMGGGMRPVVAPYYQPQQTGIYSFYTPQPGVAQVPAQPVFSDPQSYLAPTAQPQYGYGYIAPNADIDYLRRLAEIQGTGAARLPSEDLMDGS